MASINMNSLLKHIDDLRIILEKHLLDALAINESKIDEYFSNNEIKICSYVSYRKDRNRIGGGIVLHVVCIEICRQHGKTLISAWY